MLVKQRERNESMIQKGLIPIICLSWEKTHFPSIEVQDDRRESDGFQKKYLLDFQLEMDLFLQN